MGVRKRVGARLAGQRANGCKAINLVVSLRTYAAANHLWRIGQSIENTRMGMGSIACSTPGQIGLEPPVGSR